MGAIAPGGVVPIMTWFSMGIAIEAIALLVSDLGGIAHVMGMLCWIFTALIANFYRDPDRPIPKEDGIIVCPADGHVMFVMRERATGRRPNTEEMESVETDTLTGTWHPEPCSSALSFEIEQRWEAVPSGEESNTDAWRIAVFMSPLDVHVNRSPIAGTILHMEHRTGRGLRRGPYLPAYRKESAWNERVRTLFERDDGLVVEVTQISGRLTRTITPWAGKGDALRRGQRYGMIRLGSRVDVRVPASQFEPSVIGANAKDSEHPKGEFVQAGTTILFKPA